MKRIIPLRSLLGYGFVVLLCAVSIASNWNLILAAGTKDGLVLSHLSQNNRVNLLFALNSVSQVAGLMLVGSLCVTMIFLTSIVAAVIEAQSENLAKLSLLGADKWRITWYFIYALSRPLLIAAAIGAIVGIFLSRVVARIYFLAGAGASDFSPHFHFLIFVYTFLAMVMTVLLSVLLCLRKLLKINPLGIAAGRYRDLSRISWIRLLCGLSSLLCSVVVFYTANTKNEDTTSNSTLLLAFTLLLGFYLLVPAILKMLMPGVFIMVMRIFPITGVLARRYFSANIRKFTSFTAPILFALVFMCVWYMLVITGRQETKAENIAESNVTAVATDITGTNNAMVHKYLDINQSTHVLATPKRTDYRWAEVDNFQENPSIVEMAPAVIPKIWKNLLLSGDMSRVSGVNIASSREGDKLGETLKLISPSGKIVPVHIVAKLAQSSVLGYDVFVVNYANFPENMTNPNDYTIYYNGLSVADLQARGLKVVPYSTFITQYLHDQFSQQNLGLLVMIYPILMVCLALVVVNSSVISSQSKYIRRVIRSIGGSVRQDIYLSLLQLISVFALSVLFTLAAGVVLQQFLKRFLESSHWESVVYFPFRELSITLYTFMALSLIPLIIKSFTLKLKR